LLYFVLGYQLFWLYNWLFSNADIDWKLTRSCSILLNKKRRLRPCWIFAHFGSTSHHKLLHCSRPHCVYPQYPSLNIDLLAGKIANVIKKYGVGHAKSQQMLRILDYFIAKKCDWRCHCIPKNPHYCAVS